MRRPCLDARGKHLYRRTGLSELVRFNGTAFDLETNCWGRQPQQHPWAML